MRVTAGLICALTVWAGGSNVSALPPKIVSDSPYAQEWVEMPYCPQWGFTARMAGWPDRLIPQLGYIMWRESRCLPDTCPTPSRPDLRRCRDWGLTQINDHSWKRIIREQGYRIDDMLNPYHNLRFAWWLCQYSITYYNDCWKQWEK
jgi:hypothetical protein